MQLDADDDGEPFFKPPALAPPPIQQPKDNFQGEDQGPNQQSGTEHATEEVETEQAAVPTATAEQEESGNF